MGAKGIEALLSKGLVRRGNDDGLKIKWNTTGIPKLDAIVGHGLPEDRYVEIYGKWSGGKTLLAQFIAAQFQADGKSVALIDNEQTFDPDWWAETGVDVPELLVSQPDTGEAAVEVSKALIGEVNLIILDSIAAMIPMAEVERKAEEQTMGRHAQLVSKFFKQTKALMNDSGTTFILINQVRANFGPGYEPVLPGGMSQGHYASVFLEVRRGAWIKEGDTRVGFFMEIKCPKNKVAPAHGQLTLPIRFEGTYDFLDLLVMDAIDKNIIIQAGAWFRVPEELAPDTEQMKPVDGTELWQVMGKKAMVELYKENEAAQKLLEKATYDTEEMLT